MEFFYMVSGPNNALAEVALALAMGFFSIMVLAMVSMGAGASVAKYSAPIKQGVEVSLPENSAQNDAASTETASEPSILIHYRGRFFNARLEAVSPDTWTPEGQGVLAIEPTLPIAEAMALRDRLKGLNILVTTLDENWLSALKEISK